MMGISDVLRPSAGDLVEVKSAEKILETLDTNGTLDGLPFMPEMSEFCGRRFYIDRLAEKACVEYPGGFYKIREFRNNDVVLLRDLRCSGEKHGGCGRACMIFWKTAWLRNVVDAPAEIGQEVVGVQGHTASLKTKDDSERYFCQSSELVTATQPLPRIRILWKCLWDIRSGSRGILEMTWLILRPAWRKITHWLPRPVLKGDLKRTPVGDLNLKPGEWVEIKSAEEIEQTLDGRGRNRGLICDYGMCQYSGKKYKVRNRLDRMIAEPTGFMREVGNTVILENLQCLCWNTLGGCPRREFMYWREIWLRRTSSPNSSSEAGSPPGGSTEER